MKRFPTASETIEAFKLFGKVPIRWCRSCKAYYRSDEYDGHGCIAG